jgi:dienelactone hydrolase
MMLPFAGKSQVTSANVKYADGMQVLNGISVNPKTATNEQPGVLILPAWMGIDTHAKRVAGELAEMGYLTFIADIYGEGNYPLNTKEAAQQAGFYKSNVTDYRRRIRLALEQLILQGANPQRIAVIGYCFGGTGALEAARENLNIKGVVSFHGGLGRDTTVAISPIQPKILVCHGADDYFIPEQEISNFQQEMRSSNADWQMVYYADAVHSFTNPEAGNDKQKGVAYNEKAAKRSWNLMLEFFREILQ